MPRYFGTVTELEGDEAVVRLEREPGVPEKIIRAGNPVQARVGDRVLVSAPESAGTSSTWILALPLAGALGGCLLGRVLVKFWLADMVLSLMKFLRADLFIPLATNLDTLTLGCGLVGLLLSLGIAWLIIKRRKPGPDSSARILEVMNRL